MDKSAFRWLMAVVLVLNGLLILSVSPVRAAEMKVQTAMRAAATGDGSPGDANIKYTGRWDTSNLSNVKSYWSGAYFRVNFTGTTLSIKLAAAAAIYVWIDGAITYYPTANGTVNLTPTPLAAGSHSLNVIARSEYDTIQFQGLILSSGASTQPPAAKSKIIEFIGDSITAGCCALPYWVGDDYSWLTGEALNADHTQIAYSGICLQDAANCGENNIGMSNQFFKLQTIHYLGSPVWDFNRYQANQIVVNLGTNDNNVGVPDATFQSTYTTFLQNVRAKYPNAEIFVLRTFGGFKTAPTLAAVNARIIAGDTKIRYLDTTGWVFPGTADFSDSLHPSTSGHIKIKNLLTPILAGNGTSSFGDGFDGGAGKWTAVDGTWSIVSSRYTVNAGAGYKSIATGTSFSNFVYEADLSASGGNNGLLFRASNFTPGADNYSGYFAGIDAAGQGVILGKANNNWTSLGTAAMPITANTFYHMKVVASGSSIKVYVTDMVTPKITVTDTSYTSGAIGLRTFNSAAKFDAISVTSTTGVIFYQDANYGGAASTAKGKGDYAVLPGDVPNDWISSLRVPAGWVVDAYADGGFAGAVCTYTVDTSWVGAGCNDVMSSFKIH